MTITIYGWSTKGCPLGRHDAASDAPLTAPLRGGADPAGAPCLAALGRM
ncbi:hypothetical protein JD82_02793 [Prauserella rugosa]|uniref:Uncharacterized protein n=1 Tax=Prauserella rugosa TaxID=43354 RepID=A0A660CBS7_9PSEU|nr:hypothetical protein JD82_02793 [Prauserella rugosa]